MSDHTLPIKQARRILLILAVLLLPIGGQAQKFALPSGGYEDGVRVLLLGNSFTYFHDCDTMLIRIGRSQGVKICLGEYLKGGQTFGQHLNHPASGEAIAAGNYQVAFIQDFSNNAALYARDGRKDILRNTRDLKARILQASPLCRIILERTWSYSGNGAGGFASAEELDRWLDKGSKAIARKARLERSPIGEAFNLVRRERPDIPLLGPDDKHQSAAGSYLKCCVNWLILSGKPFSGEVDACGLDPDTARYLRDAAERVVRN